MAEPARHMTGKERTFSEDEIIVSKTDKTGRLTYVNDVFLSVSGFEECELIGQQHSIVRHPQTPRCLFKLMWERIESGKEVFVYVNNRAKCGDHYWVFAHATPNFNASGQIVGYHSNRRVPKRSALVTLQPLYERLRQEEARHSDTKQGLAASMQMLTDALAKEGMRYEEFVLDL
ncbi:MAG TPA: PAS domain-containing protein [Patescibacteria group bacterium]|nr:PAS domain-containing protein [Patescibacteria group bacterium]